MRKMFKNLYYILVINIAYCSVHKCYKECCEKCCNCFKGDKDFEQLETSKGEEINEKLQIRKDERSKFLSELEFLNFQDNNGDLIEIRENNNTNLKSIFDKILDLKNDISTELTLGEKEFQLITLKNKIEENISIYYLSQLKTDKNISFSVQMISNDFVQEKWKQNIEEQIKNMYRLQYHENFLLFYGAYYYKGYIFVCSEFFHNLNIKENDQGNYIEYNNFAKQLLNILKTLRKYNVVCESIRLDDLFYSQKIVDNKTQSPILKFVNFTKFLKNGEVENNNGLCSITLFNYETPSLSSFVYKQWINVFNLLQNNLNVYGTIETEQIENVLGNIALGKSVINNNPFYINGYNENLFFIALLLYSYKNGEAPNFVNEESLRFIFRNTEEYLEKDIENIKKKINSFNKYFDSDNYKNHKDELYNKIFLKIKEKDDNETIEINEFIEELNSEN